MGETAPLIILAPYTTFINFNLFNGPMAALPTLIYTTSATTWTRRSHACGQPRSR